MELLLKNAIVVSIDDIDKEGKIKIRILPELEGVEDDLLPSAIPFNTILTSNSMENSLPEENSTIRVLVDKHWKRFYYIGGNRYFYNLFDFTKVENKLNSIEEITNKDYKNLKFKLYEDGGLSFHNNEEGSHGFLHKSGSYSIFDGEGNIIVNSGLNKIKIKNDLSDLKTIIDNIQSIIQNLITPLNLISPNGPVTYNLASQDLPKITETKVLIDNLLETNT